jgi:hypothetical protein
VWADAMVIAVSANEDMKANDANARCVQHQVGSSVAALGEASAQVMALAHVTHSGRGQPATKLPAQTTALRTVCALTAVVHASKALLGTTARVVVALLTV